MTKEKTRRKWKGIKIRNFNGLMILVSCALYICLLMATAYTARNYEQLVQLTNDYIYLEETSSTVMKASDYLTEQVRMYVQTQNPEHALQYSEEVTVTRTRDNALSVLHQYPTLSTQDNQLSMAVYESNTLMIRELYAIALVADAKGHLEIAKLPILADTVIDINDSLLSPQEKIEKARGMVFDTEYQTMKQHIYEHLDAFTRSILMSTKSQLGAGMDDLYNSIHTQRVLLSVLVILNAVTFLVITILVIRPLHAAIRNVRNRELFPESGAYEFRYLARTYNNIHRRSDALAASEALLRSQTQQDEVTGLFNRTHFYKAAAQFISDSNEETYIVTMDISNFDIINEHYGMNTGDRLLKDIADQLREFDKNGRIIFARFILDHYYMCIPKSEYEQISFPKTFKTFLEDMDVHVVYGVFPVEDKEMPVNVMCDRALGAAHDKTYNYVDYIHFYNDSVHQQTLLAQELEADMETALAERQFYVVVQPKYDPIAEQIVGAEALVRWQHPEKGIISPGVFIDIFERNGFITLLDHFVWEETCRLQAQMKQSGIKTVPISINVSRIHFYNRELRSKLLELIRKYELDPSDIELEITESICGEDAENIFDIIRELQSHGFRVAMDDFGSGYSSLNMLKEMPLDIIKMDLRFLGGDETKSYVILKSLIEMAQTMGLNVVVEGVELLSQVEFLRQFKTCYLQGFYYSRPVAPDIFEDMLKHN